jgi:inner membrane protein involved in colicin E2 resistance
MNDAPMTLPSLQARLKTRSMGMKLVVVCGLALVMTIPALVAGGLVEERTQRDPDVAREIGGHVGGQQTFPGPSLAIPYTVPAQSTGSELEHGTYLVFPVQGGATVKTRTEERRRSLFKVPVFDSRLAVIGGSKSLPDALYTGQIQENLGRAKSFLASLARDRLQIHSCQGASTSKWIYFHQK